MKNYLQKNLRQVSFNSLWIIVTVLLHVSTAILLTFSTNAIIAKDLQTFLGKKYDKLPKKQPVAFFN